MSPLLSNLILGEVSEAFWASVSSPIRSLGVKAGKKHPRERPWSYGWSMLRTGALLRRRSMAELDRWYEAAGRALHEEGRKPHTPEGAKEILAEIGLDPNLVDKALEDATTHDEVRAEHESVVNRGGYGVPRLVFEDDTCLFGPVVTPAPTGEAAMRLWNLFDRGLAGGEPPLYVKNLEALEARRKRLAEL